MLAVFVWHGTLQRMSKACEPFSQHGPPAHVPKPGLESVQAAARQDGHMDSQPLPKYSGAMGESAA